MKNCEKNIRDIMPLLQTQPVTLTENGISLVAESKFV